MPHNHDIQFSRPVPQKRCIAHSSDFHFATAQSGVIGMILVRCTMVDGGTEEHRNIASSY